MIYGHNGTIHRTTKLDVEVDRDGKVVSVWYRCMLLPFKQANVDQPRAASMRSCYADKKKIRPLLAVEVGDI